MTSEIHEAVLRAQRDFQEGPLHAEFIFPDPIEDQPVHALHAMKAHNRGREGPDGRRTLSYANIPRGITFADALGRGSHPKARALFCCVDLCREFNSPNILIMHLGMSALSLLTYISDSPVVSPHLSRHPNHLTPNPASYPLFS